MFAGQFLRRLGWWGCDWGLQPLSPCGGYQGDEHLRPVCGIMAGWILIDPDPNFSEFLHEIKHDIFCRGVRVDHILARYVLNGAEREIVLGSVPPRQWRVSLTQRRVRRGLFAPEHVMISVPAPTVSLQHLGNLMGVRTRLLN